MANPKAGDLIQGTGGLRKIRIAAKGHGKRGGARVIYYHFVSASQIAFLLAYPKGEQEDLTSDQKKVLRQVIEKWR
ncbi:Toxin HigB-2 [compost metagenome]